ncbi:MAG: alpha/beta fold hydrolase [Candidatus Thorarchaeota archaeon]
MTIVKIHDTDLFYTTTGFGTPFLVMHGGLGLDHTYFRPELDRLSEEMQLIYYDYRGHGRSGRVPITTISWERLADDAEELRIILNHDKIGIIGHSGGGLVALKYAIKYTQNVSHLILMNTFPAFDNFHVKEFMAGIQAKNPTPEILKAVNAPSPSTIEDFKNQYRVLNYLYLHNYNSEIKKRFEEIFENMIFNFEALAVTNSLLIKYNVLSDLKNITTPTLVIGGIGDGIVPISEIQRLHDNIPNSEMYILEKSGHYPFLEEPETLIKIVLDWYNKVE